MNNELDAMPDEELDLALSPKNFVTDGDCMFAKGTKIGEFEIASFLGNSGIGELYLAKSVVSRKRFAIKVLPPSAIASPEFESHFSELKSKVLGRIHPHIVHIQKMGLHNDDVLDYPYIAMDYIESPLGRPQTLQDLLGDNDRLSEAKTLKTVLQLCDALDYAHNSRDGAFVHSDLKPGNILFDTANLTRITDFDAMELLGRRFVKDTVMHCVNKVRSQEWSDLILRPETIRMPSAMNLENLERNLENTESHLLLDSPGKFSFKDFGLSWLVKGDGLRDLIGKIKGESGKGPAGGAKPGEKAFKRQGQRSGSPTGATAVFAVLDSYDYMSPEQKAGLPITPQSNIYSLGLIIYRMLTGRKMSGCWDLPSKFGVGKGWDEIVVKCLKMEPEDRYGSIAELKTALLSVRRRKLGMGRMLAMAAAIVLLSSFAAIFWGNGLAGKLAEVFSMREKRSAASDRKSFALTVKVTPPGAKTVIRKGGKLIGEYGALSADGATLDVEPGEYSVCAILPGRKGVKLDFAADKTLEEIVIDIPAAGEPRTYMRRDDLPLPTVGFPWEIPDMKIDMIPISICSNNDNVKRPFWIASSEIWQWQFEKIMRHNPSFFRDGKTLPVERVSLAEAMEFCSRLNLIERQAGRLPDGYIYRLPTEREWKYCARAGSAANGFPQDDGQRIQGRAWFAANSGGRPHPAASLKPDAWGIFDIQGNVWELCADIVKRPNPDSPEHSIFVYLAKGGAWNCDPEKLSLDSRLIVKAFDKQMPETGFRIALAPPLESAILDEMKGDAEGERR